MLLLIGQAGTAASVAAAPSVKTISPPTQAALVVRSGLSQTRSAAAPGASLPRSGLPIRSAGILVAAATASPRLMPSATMLATARSIRSAEPASVPSARTGGAPSAGGSVTASPPSRYSPGGMPAGAAASVTSAIRPGAARNASAQTGPAT